MASRDPQEGQATAPGQPDDQPRPVMQAQVVLDRLGFSSGVVDGRESAAMRNAVRGFQEANDLAVTGSLDAATLQTMSRWSNIRATRVVTIPADFAAGPFGALPPKPEDQAKLSALHYQTLDEKLAERFHTTPETLRGLNPGQAAFGAGQTIRVPNVGADAIAADAAGDAEWRRTLAMLGVGSNQPKVDKVVVSKSRNTLEAYDKAGRLVAVFTATLGSRHDPLPIGTWTIKGVARNPPFHYNPKLFWDVSDAKGQHLLPPGPNSPVGVVWIDLNKAHYGIHGTPEPAAIGRNESHGCVRLTNWDAARLAQMVSPGTTAVFER